MTIGQTSGTYNFVNQFSNFEMLVDAFERCGKQPTELTQSMLASARRSLNLILQTMPQNGPALWAVQLLTQTLVQGVATITLPNNVSSILDVHIDTTVGSNTTSRVMTPMSRTDYSSLPYKQQQGFPYSYWVDRQVPSTMTFWEVPDGNGPYVLNAYYLSQLQDANLGMGEVPNLQFRALEMMTARLAKKLAVKFAPDKYAMLKGEFDEEFGTWAEEEREKVDMTFEPDMSGYFRE